MTILSATINNNNNNNNNIYDNVHSSSTRQIQQYVDNDDDDNNNYYYNHLSLFRNALPLSRLGRHHLTYESYYDTLMNHTNYGTEYNQSDYRSKHYTLVLVIEPVRNETTTTDNNNNGGRILLGLKQRGFGKGLYNSFGGKVDKEIDGDDDDDNNNNTIIDCAARELYEETNISIPKEQMINKQLGTLYFTFDDNPIQMIVHLFCLQCRTKQHTTDNDNSSNNIDDSNNFIYIDPTTIRGCEEITTEWFHNWYDDLPLDKMFVDDTIWLTRVLASMSNQNNRQQQSSLSINGWFHLAAGGTDTNTLLHHYMNITTKTPTPEPTILQPIGKATPKQIDRSSMKANNTNSSNENNRIDTTANTKKPFTLEQRLFHALHDNKIHSPTIKEFNECYAFCNAARSFFWSNNNSKQKKKMMIKNKSLASQISLVIDVAGGHGTLAALFLITVPTIQRAIVIDPSSIESGKRGIRNGFGTMFDINKLQYRHECLRTGLPSELQSAIHNSCLLPCQILVVACHACQHLSDEIIEIAIQHKVHVAVLPCCQKDPTPGDVWKKVCRNLSSSLTSSVLVNGNDGIKKEIENNDASRTLISIAATMDLLLAGKAMSWSTGYTDVRMKILNHKITPQNRLILCRSPFQPLPFIGPTMDNVVCDNINNNDNDMDMQKQQQQNKKLNHQHERLKIAYNRAHAHSHTTKHSDTNVGTKSSKIISNYDNNIVLDPTHFTTTICKSFLSSFKALLLFNYWQLPAGIVLGFTLGTAFSSSTQKRKVT